MGSILDVRAKDLPETVEHLTSIRTTQKDLLMKYMNLEQIDENLSTEVEDCVEVTGTIRKSKSLFRKSQQKQSKKTVLENEVDLFLSIQYNGNTEINSILGWWEKNEQKFKHVAKLARQYIPIPLTSLPKDYYSYKYSAECLKMANLDKKDKKQGIITTF